MSVKDQFKVRRIKKRETYDWLLHKHYAKKIPSVIQHSFGLFDTRNILVGVSVFGISGNSNLNGINGIPVVELTRLVVNDKKPKNTTSYFVGQCLKMINHNGFVVSFADSNYNHHGYIYQATNWIYTGKSSPAQVYSNGKTEMHSKSFSDKYGRRDKKFAESIGFRVIRKKPKHRYFYILGDKRECRKYKGELLKVYDVKPYPKGDNKKYDASYKPKVQSTLF